METDLWTIFATVISVFLIKWFIEKTGFLDKLMNNLKVWAVGRLFATLIRSPTVQDEVDSATPINVGKQEPTGTSNEGIESAKLIEKPKAPEEAILRVFPNSIILQPTNFDAMEPVPRIKIFAMIMAERMIDSVLPILSFMLNNPSNKQIKP